MLKNLAVWLAFGVDFHTFYEAAHISENIDGICSLLKLSLLFHIKFRKLPALRLSYENILFTTKSYEFLASERTIWYILYYRGERSVIVVNNIDENWISLEEAAKHLDVTKDSIRNWIKKTDIPAHKIGKLWKFKKSELDEWVRSGKSAFEHKK